MVVKPNIKIIDKYSLEISKLLAILTRQKAKTYRPSTTRSHQSRHFGIINLSCARAMESPYRTENASHL